MNKNPIALHDIKVYLKLNSDSPITFDSIRGKPLSEMMIHIGKNIFEETLYMKTYKIVLMMMMNTFDT